MPDKAPRMMKLGAMLDGVGIDPYTWLDPELPGDASVSIDWHIEQARAAEAAKFDLVFFADAPFVPPTTRPHSLNKLEPLTLLAALAVATKNIGLVSTATTSFWEPYNLARQFASIDQISHGRAGWNVVTTALAGAAANFGLAEHADHATRYERASEFVEVVKGLWDSYEDDAFPRDKERRIFIDPTKQHRLDHKGRFFSVAGPLGCARSRQGHPVIFQAGSSNEGRDLSARIAECTFQDGASGIESAQEYYADMKARVASHGRDPQAVKILPALVNPIVADTDEEAAAVQEAEQRRHDINKLLIELGRPFNYHDFSKYDLDTPFPDLSGLKLDSYKGRSEWIIRTARAEKLTLRQAAYRFDIARSHFVGSPETIANTMERWFRDGAADGFIIQIRSPKAFRMLRERVVPILQKRGLFRTEYEHDTLRGNLGIPVPPNRYSSRRDS